MMRRTIALAIACGGLAGCGLPTMIQGTQTTFSGEARRPLQETADCLFEAMQASQGSSVRKTDLPSKGLAYIELTSEGVRFWRYTLTASGAKATRVELESFKPALSEGATGSFQKAYIAPAESCGIQRVGA